jgi:hypothetical protein
MKERDLSMAIQVIADGFRLKEEVVIARKMMGDCESGLQLASKRMGTILAGMITPQLLDGIASHYFTQASLLAQYDENARQFLACQWEISREEVDGRIEQIRAANNWPGAYPWLIWKHVRSGVTFDEEGKVDYGSWLPF